MWRERQSVIAWVEHTRRKTVAFYGNTQISIHHCHTVSVEGCHDLYVATVQTVKVIHQPATQLTNSCTPDTVPILVVIQGK